MIMFLWRPNQHSKDYAFMQQIPKDAEDAEEFETGLGPDTFDDEN